MTRLATPKDWSCMLIDYDHSRNLHTLEGAAAALSRPFRRTPKSVLDVGCGTGIWLRAAAELGVREISADGIIAEADELEIARDLISQVDLTSSFSLGRRFDVALSGRGCRSLGAG
ncbi:MAG: methyltransferase domain-containing protein [Hyphomicrobiales bacterium]|nr:methyltransferase domain-containing protein [Hyphomicrobiales bacterium]